MESCFQIGATTKASHPSLFNEEIKIPPDARLRRRDSSIRWAHFLQHRVRQLGPRPTRGCTPTVECLIQARPHEEQECALLE
jgi:hypothetical protein